MAQLQEQVALKDAEIERLHSQLSRTAALHGDHAEKGSWFDCDRIQLPLGPAPFSMSRHVCLNEYICVCLCE